MHQLKVGDCCAKLTGIIVIPIPLARTVNTAQHRITLMEFVEQLVDIELRRRCHCHKLRHMNPWSWYKISLTASAPGTYGHRDHRIWPHQTLFCEVHRREESTYSTRSRNLNDLKENINAKSMVVTTQCSSERRRNMEWRVQLCLEDEGGHFQYLK